MKWQYWGELVMTCGEVERVLPELLDGAPDSAYQTAFESHLKGCADCADLVSDLKLISSSAQDLAESEEPSPRVWLGIAAQLRAEGVIRETDRAPARESKRSLWGQWWLVPVAAAVLAGSAYVLSHKPVAQVAVQQTPAITAPANAVPGTVPATAPITSQAVPQPTRAENTKEHAPAVARGTKPEPPMVEAPSSADDQQFLSVVSTLGSSTRATYEKQLQDVNAEIREVQAYLQRNPGDTDARQHLMEAYEQKALLYQIALDRIQ
jgi:hypothetical protein